MNITFLVGNGFDLACGLKSQYKDVYTEYNTIRNPGDSDCVVKFRTQLDKKDKTWGDFELGMAAHATMFSNEADFIDCVRDFSLFLNDYLVNQQKLFWNRFAEYDKYAKPAVLKHLAESLYQFYSGTTNNTVQHIEKLLLTAKRVSFNFISFNYTTVFEEIMRNAINYNAVTGNIFVHNKNCDINLENTIHIHGKLSQDWVLGVDNLEQFSNILFPITEDFKHCFIKPYFNQTFDKNRVVQASKTIQQSDVLCIIGMSLGESDLTWKNKIAEWLSESTEHHLFYYSLEMMEKTKITAFDRVRLEREAKQQLCSKLGINNEDCFEQIHIPISKWLFNIRRMTYTYTTGEHVAHPPIR